MLRVSSKIKIGSEQPQDEASLDIAHELEAVYAQVSADIAARGPACWASGRCCNFEKTGHRLYVTGLEAAYALRNGPQVIVADRVINTGLSLPQIADARASGGCPFQVDNLCGIHSVKPLGCRVYFCDRSATEWQADLTEKSLREIRAIHDRHHIPYRYGEWRTMLEHLSTTQIQESEL